DLEHADFLLNETNPKAAQALDLLLGVQGWRRFAEQYPDQFRQRDAVEAERFLVIEGRSRQRALDTRFAQEQELVQAYVPKIRDLSEQLRVANTEKVAVEQKYGNFAADLQARRQTEISADQDYHAALARLAPYENTHRELRLW